MPKNSAFNLEVITENLKSVIPCKNNSINLSENDAPPKKKSSLKKDLFTKIAKKTKINQDNARSHKIEKKYSEKKVLTATDLFSRIETNNEMITSEKNIRKKSSDDDSENQEEQKIILDNYELNELDYEEAVKLDKRNCCQIYWSLLKREHIIFFTFCNKDHNIFFIKFIRLIFLICGDMAYNVFFFSDETMHKTYLNYGKYNFYQQIPQIAISTVVSNIIDVFLSFLCMTDKYYYEIKKLDKNNKLEIFSKLKTIKKKLIFFFIFITIMFSFYWYSIACFCAVYKNTQSAFIKDSLSSFGLGLIYPFALYLFPAILRLIALKCKISCIYFISGIIPFF